MRYKQKSGDQNHAALTSQCLRAATGPLQFSLRHWNLRNLTLQITGDFFRQHSTFARLYNAAASLASRLRSAGSLAISLINLEYINDYYTQVNGNVKLTIHDHF